MVNTTDQWKNILFLAIIGLLMYLVYQNEQQDDYGKSFKGETIGLLTRLKSNDEHGYTLQYYFYTDKKNRAVVFVKSYDRKDFNKFFKVKYDIDKPEENYIDLKEELLPDSITLVKAGFTKIKYYIYDAGVTCKYIEKSKWK
ncbi:hypothetical protein B0A80_07255 [Flavobacterium tructae]|nr:hypothetical protein B0A80_07255 [Flavobacterium tructae]